jgi:hypothetical protein
MYFSLLNITDRMNVQKLREVVFPPIQNLVGNCKHITILIFY